MKLQSCSLNCGVKRIQVLANPSENYSHQCLLAWGLGVCLSFLILSSILHALPRTVTLVQRGTVNHDPE